MTNFASSENNTAADSSARKPAYRIGALLPDGWIVGPVSPDTGVVIAIEPESSAPRGYRKWSEGQEHASMLAGQGHLEARQPSDTELKAIYNQIVSVGYNRHTRFKLEKLHPGDLGPEYWSSRLHPEFGNVAKICKLNDGSQNWYKTHGASASVRCIRSQPDIVIDTSPSGGGTEEQSRGTEDLIDNRPYEMGDVLPDGWIVGPVSPETGLPMEIEPKLSSISRNTYQEAWNHAAALRQMGHKNARLPSVSECEEIQEEIVGGGRNKLADLRVSSDFDFTNSYWASNSIMMPSSSYGSPIDSDVRRVSSVYAYGRERGYESARSSSCDNLVRCVRDQLCPQIA